MRVDDGVEAIRRGVALRDWDNVDAIRFGTDMVDDATRARVADVDLALFVTALRAGVEGIGSRLEPSTAAVYWEFDVDNGWESAFFLCRTYQPESRRDDEWASDFDPLAVMSGPSMPRLAELRPPTWEGIDSDAVLNVLLIARTVAAFGRATVGWRHRIPVTAGYHDQSVVFRIAGPLDG